MKKLIIFTALAVTALTLGACQSNQSCCATSCSSPTTCATPLK